MLKNSLKELQSIIYTSFEKYYKITKDKHLLSFDIGAKNVGISFYDNNLKEARMLGVLKRGNNEEGSLRRQINRLIMSEINNEIYGERKVIGGWVVGHPLDKEGRESWQCNKVYEFLLECLREDIKVPPIYLMDERFSTVASRTNFFIKTGIGDNRKRNQSMKSFFEQKDMRAALIILQTFIEKGKNI